MDALIIVTHIVSRAFFNKCLCIQKAYRKYGTVFILLDNSVKLPIEYQTCFNIVRFDWESLMSMGYKPIRNSMIPGSNHFITMWFQLNNPGYRFYWSMEYDVVYTGKWSEFFKQAYTLGGDFQACHIRNFHENPNWFWWDAMHIPDSLDVRLTDKENRVRSFNPIYRISDEALYCLHKYFKSGLSGHHELVIPSILKINGFELVDFGGTGSYVRRGYEEKFYISQNRNGTLGSMSHLPFKNESLAITIPNKLVHPIKYFDGV